MIRFTVPIEPVGQKRARHRIVKSGSRVFSTTYTDKDQRTQKEKFLALAYEHRPDVPFDNALLLGVKAFLPVPKSKSKKFREAALAGEIRPTKKPDMDNIVKHVKDCLNGVFWTDDKLVVGYLDTGKYYSEFGRYEIEIEEL